MPLWARRISEAIWFDFFNQKIQLLLFLLEDQEKLKKKKGENINGESQDRFYLIFLNRKCRFFTLAWRPRKTKKKMVKISTANLRTEFIWFFLTENKDFLLCLEDQEKLFKKMVKKYFFFLNHQREPSAFVQFSTWLLIIIIFYLGTQLT